jgi:hypothetical protein
LRILDHEVAATAIGDGEPSTFSEPGRLVVQSRLAGAAVRERAADGP